MMDSATDEAVVYLDTASRESRGSRIATRMASILVELGEDVGREGLLETPRRYESAMRFLTSGYSMSPEEVIGNALFESEGEGMVLVRDIELFSLCEHHLLPFFGRAHVAYLPGAKIVGLSKIPRLVDLFARRLQVQERLTREVGETLARVLDAKGVAVVIEATHMCMMMRGVQKQCSQTRTSFMHGEFRRNGELRQEFLSGLRHHE
jgi:GTP cyclohydrolase IA